MYNNKLGNRQVIYGVLLNLYKKSINMKKQGLAADISDALKRIATRYITSYIISIELWDKCHAVKVLVSVYYSNQL